MMREIKFRAWDKQDQRMIVDRQNFIPLLVTNKGVLRLSPYHEEPNYHHFLEDERFEIMQYTGLKDKNGKEIYEGDIVQTDNYPLTKEDGYVGVIECENYGCFLTKKVKANAGVRGISDGISEWLIDFEDDGLEIVGNIYETPELLEVQK